MAQITAWKCDYKGTIFTDKDRYLKHLKTFARKRYHERQSDKRIVLAREHLKSARTFSQLEKLIPEAVDIYYEPFDFGYENVKVSMEKMQFNICQSISHDCPIGKKTNWCGTNKDLPRGYPGVGGQIQICTTNEAKLNDNVRHLIDVGEVHSSIKSLCGFGFGFGNRLNLLSSIGIHTGGGGGARGDDDWSFGLSLFCEDFPHLDELNDLHKKFLVNERYDRIMEHRRKRELMIEDIIT